MRRRPVLRRVSNRAKDLLFLPGTGRLWRERLKGKVMALVYHRVDDPSRFDFLERGGTPVIRPEALADELAWLKAHGARFKTLADLRRGELPAADEWGVLVTFDDGFRDNYRLGLEVLDSLDIQGVLFQCSAMIDGAELIPEHALYWHAAQPQNRQDLQAAVRDAGWPEAIDGGDQVLIDRVGRWIRHVPIASLTGVVERMGARHSTQELASALYPTAADLRRAVAGGHEIGSHGHRHLHRATLSAVEFEHELLASVGCIKAKAGVRPQAFSYPFNGYRPGDREICSRYFRQTLTVDGRAIERGTDPLAMARFTWPGPARNRLRLRRWLLTGRI